MLCHFLYVSDVSRSSELIWMCLEFRLVEPPDVALKVWSRICLQATKLVSSDGYVNYSRSTNQKRPLSNISIMQCLIYQKTFAYVPLRSL